MLERRRIRRILSAMTRNNDLMMDRDNLLRQVQMDENDLDEFLDVLEHLNVIYNQDGYYQLNLQKYREIVNEEIPSLKPLLNALDPVKNRVDSISLFNPIAPTSFDLSKGEFIIITDLDSESVIQHVLKNVELNNYTTNIMMKSQLLEYYGSHKEDMNRDVLLEIL